MAIAYTRQSSFADGDTITAALFNNEYNQLVNAFAYSSSNASTTGHRHDGTAGQGGNIPQIGDLDFLNKIVVDSTNNRWGFYVEVSSSAVEQIRLQDGALLPVTDSDVDLGTSSLYFKDAYIDSITTTGNVAVGGNLTVTGTTTFNGGTITMGDAATDNVVFGADVDSNIIPDDDNTYDLGSSSQEWKDLYVDGIAYLDGINFNGTAITATAAELNILDGVTSTAAELNILDGVTSTAAELNILDGVTSTTAELNILDGVTSTTAELNILDGVTATAAELNLLDGSTANTVVNSKAVIYGSSGELAGTLSTAAQTNITSLGTLTTLTVDDITINGSTISDSGSLTIDVAGDIILDADNGDVTFVDGGTTFGKISNSAGNLLINSEVNDKDIQFNGKDGGLDVTALQLDMSQAGRATFSENVIVTGELSAATLDISGDVDIDGTLEADAITVNGTTLAETISDTVGAMVDSNTETNITVTYDDTDNTLDFVIGTLNQDTTGNAATATALETARTIGGVSFDGTANINLPGVNTAGNQDTTGNAATATTAGTVTTAAQTNITSVGTLTTLTVDDITINGSTISDSGDLTVDVGGDIILDTGGDDIKFKVGGTDFGSISYSNSNLLLNSAVSNGDIIFKGNDGGSTITALTLDMSEAGAATFNAGATFSGNGKFTGTTPILRFTETDTTDLNTRLAHGGGLFFISTENDAESSNTPRLAIDHSSGNVGIGTSSPSVELDVRDDGTSGVAVIGVRGGTNGAGAINISGHGTTYDSTSFDLIQNSTGAFVQHRANLPLMFATNNTERMRITSGGNVGIGTSSPSTPLHVNGTITFGDSHTIGDDSDDNLTISSSANENIIIDSSDDIILDAGGGDWKFKDDGTDIGLIANSSSDLIIQSMVSDKDMLFRGNDGGSTIVALTLDMSDAGKAIFNSGATFGSHTRVNGDFSVSAASGEDRFAILPQSAGSGTIFFSGNEGLTGYEPLTMDFEDLRLRTSGTERMRIDSSGNFGLGTSSPTSYNSNGDNLVVAGSGNTGITIAAGTSDDTNIFFADGTSGDAAYRGIIRYNHSDDNFEFYTAATERMHIDSTGVGIGTSSPTEKLTVAGAITTTGALSDDRTSTGAMDFSSGITRFVSYGASGTGGIFAFRTASGGASSTERMRIDGSGNVGIGTASPSQLLNLQAQSPFIQFNQTGTDSFAGINFGDDDDANDGQILYDHDSRYMRFQVANAERVRIDASGRVGIGDTSPDNTLHVNSGTSNVVAKFESTDSIAAIQLKDNNGEAEIGNVGNDIAFFPAGAEKVRIDSSGNVGLGTASPSKSLHILNADPVIRLEDSSPSAYAEIDGAGGDLIISCDAGDGDANSVINFKVDNSEKMRITSDGHLLIGTTSNQGVGGISFEKGGSGFTTHNNNNAASGGYEFYVFRRSSTQIGSIAQNGTTGIQLNTSSDARLKEVTGSARGLDVINNLNPVAYNWKADNRADEGLIAQEVEEFMPNAVSQTEDGYYMMDYSKLVTPLIKAVQEQQEEIEKLKKDSHSPKGLEDMDGYGDLIDTIETLRAEIAILKGE